MIKTLRTKKVELSYTIKLEKTSIKDILANFDSFLMEKFGDRLKSHLYTYFIYEGTLYIYCILELEKRIDSKKVVQYFTFISNTPKRVNTFVEDLTDLVETYNLNYNTLDREISKGVCYSLDLKKLWKSSSSSKLKKKSPKEKN